MRLPTLIKYCWWKTATERWNRLYYCSRDDVVFIPEEEGRGCVAVEQVQSFLYGD